MIVGSKVSLSIYAYLMYTDFIIIHQIGSPHMSFKLNECQQLSFTDSLLQLTAREKKALENSWAKIFADELFPAINEESFSVLYSDHRASRPNTPVNIVVGACIIKELFDYSDDEIVEGLMLDLRMQYALHTTSFDEQPLSDKSLSRFRKKCYEYETLYGIDLYADCIKSLSGQIAKLMKLDGRIRRMDSMMINSNMKLLSRLELFYTCISRLVIHIFKKEPDRIPEELRHYTEANDYNKIFYHYKSSESTDRTENLLKDTEQVLALCGDDYEDTTEYQLFIRFLSEQTVVENGTRRMATKEDKKGDSHNLQNPTDPDATYRIKAGKHYRGYVGNLEETVGENGSVITDYEYEKNTYSDTRFIKERIEELPKQDEAMLLVTDGGYYSNDIVEEGKQKNINIVTTALKGKETNEFRLRFETDEEKKRIIRCPAGHEPKSCCYKASNDEFKISFESETCRNCPYQKQCGPKIFKKVAKILLTRKSFIRHELQIKMKEPDFEKYSRLRNGIETVPSVLRRHYRLDKLPRSRVKGKFFFGSKIMAFNFRKLFNYRKGLGRYALNPLLS